MDFNNLLNASQKARKRKRGKEYVCGFQFNLEEGLITLQKELKDETYRPGRYHTFYINDPKRRLISAAPYRDRVIHHAICNVIEPVFERGFIYDSYANRLNKGTHRAIFRYSRFCSKNAYVLKCDIQKYFPSIDHEILCNLIEKKIKCQRTLRLIKVIIESSNPQEVITTYFPGDDPSEPFRRRRGLPIGNLTSQFFANIYLNPLDHFIKEVLSCRNYIRYMDDFVLFGNDKSLLNEWRRQIIRYLEGLRLLLHENKSRVYRTADGVEFLGFRIFPGYRRLKRASVRRFIKRMKGMQIAYAQGLVDHERIKRSIISWNAHAAYGNTYRLRERIFSELCFKKGNIRTMV